MRMFETWSIVGLIGVIVTPLAIAGTKEDLDFVKGARGKAIAAWMNEAGERGFQGAILAARDGEVVAALGVGHADLEGEVPNTSATLFEVASFSKQFTAAAALRLVDKGKLDLDDPIADHLPGVPESCAEITVRHLLQNTSGIPGTNSRGGGDDLAAVLPLFLEGGPRHPPGTHWEYWNQGWALASEIIARAGGASFVDVCRRELFKPAKMTATCFTGDEAPRRSTVAVGRSSRGEEPRSALDHPYGDSYGFQYRGMGGVVTSVWDLWRWDRALAGRKLLKKGSLEELFRPGLESYALGWYVKEERGRVVQSHGGSVRGFVCWAERYPEEDACVFALSNDDGTPIETVARAVEQILFSGETSIVYPDGKDAEGGRFLVGVYESPDGTLRIHIAGTSIRASVDWKSGEQSRMLISRDRDGEFAVFVNEDRYDLSIAERTEEQAVTLGLWGRTFRRTDG